MAKTEAVTIKVSEDARKALRIIAAMTDESIIDVVNRLTKAELTKVEAQRATRGRIGGSVASIAPERTSSKS